MPLLLQPTSMTSSLVAQVVNNLPAMQECRFDSWDGKLPWRRDRLPIPVFLSFPGGSAGKESTSSAGDLGLVPKLGRSPGRRHGNPLQHFCLENPMDRGAWQLQSIESQRVRHNLATKHSSSKKGDILENNNESCHIATLYKEVNS